MKQPLITIIMPTYNRGYCIKNTIASVQAQTATNWLLFIVDDGSTDDTKNLILSLNDPRITYTYQQNAGPAAARNTALKLAQTKWVAYLDSDNELLPEFIATMLEELAAHPHAVFAIPQAHRTLELYENGTLVRIVDDSKDTPPGITLKDIYMQKLHFDTNGFVHLRSLYDEGIRWDESLPAMEDWDIAMTIGAKYPDGFLYVEKVLYNYHQRYGSDGLVSSKTYGDWADVFEQMYQKHKHDALLVGQQWHPAKVQKWRALQKDYELGKLPPYHLYYFTRDSLQN